MSAIFDKLKGLRPSPTAARTSSRRGRKQGSRAKRWLGYTALYLVSFLVFSYWFFPYDRVRDVIVQEVEYPKGPTGRGERAVSNSKSKSCPPPG